MNMGVVVKIAWVFCRSGHCPSEAQSANGRGGDTIARHLLPVGLAFAKAAEDISWAVRGQAYANVQGWDTWMKS